MKSCGRRRWSSLAIQSHSATTNTPLKVFAYIHYPYRYRKATVDDKLTVSPPTIAIEHMSFLQVSLPEIAITRKADNKEHGAEQACWMVASLRNIFTPGGLLHVRL